LIDSYIRVHNPLSRRRGRKHICILYVSHAIQHSHSTVHLPAERGIVGIHGGELLHNHVVGSYGHGIAQIGPTATAAAEHLPRPSAGGPRLEQAQVHVPRGQVPVELQRDAHQRIRVVRRQLKTKGKRRITIRPNHRGQKKCPITGLRTLRRTSYTSFPIGVKRYWILYSSHRGLVMFGKERSARIGRVCKCDFKKSRSIPCHPKRVLDNEYGKYGRLQKSVPANSHGNVRVLTLFSHRR